jgi:hypothetical protein
MGSAFQGAREKKGPFFTEPKVGKVHQRHSFSSVCRYMFFDRFHHLNDAGYRGKDLLPPRFLSGTGYPHRVKSPTSRTTSSAPWKFNFRNLLGKKT